MAKVKYTYNPVTCKYDPIIVTPRTFGRATFRFLAVSLFIGLAGSIYFHFQYPYLDETLQAQENAYLKSEWRLLGKRLDNSSQQLSSLEKNDDQNFRVILDLDPLSPSQREAGVGGRPKESETISYPLIKLAYDKAAKIKNRLDIQRQSIDQLKAELGKKERMWASRPAIQPINNKDLTHLHTIFGMRLHPILGYVRPHNGLDFTAPHGSPVYATGDAVVMYTGFSTYGNVIYLDHGFGFETRYAHLTRYIVEPGQVIKRGQIIGYVGNTGLSAAPHLHYEVHYKNVAINPINFFQRDLSNKEYEKLIELGSKSTTSLD
jgi:murein DD-endopeptidase MepM/ murein hydrolase activator NlpD